MADVAFVPVTTGTVDLASYLATVELIETARATNDRLQAFTLLARTRPNTNMGAAAKKAPTMAERLARSSPPCSPPLDAPSARTCG